MKSLEECVVTAMDGTDSELFTYLPYMLQDIWEIGTDPEIIIGLIGRYFKEYKNLKVLDLGCGKGAVSIKVAYKYGCNCHGIDAMPEFILNARKKAIEYKVEHLCRFEAGDIREKVKELPDYDIIILGSIGPVFGDYNATLTKLSKKLNKNGVFIVDDGYIDDKSY
ncbi:MAG: class I SAM-dependent methyltransferase [Halobacteriota archaeon]|nr:class I SAM-dependent methyltransferase [Halobacteriota archaeon]